MQHNFDHLRELPGSPQEQEWLRERLETLSVREGYALTAAIQRRPESMADAINHIQSLEDYRIFSDAGDYEKLGECYLNMLAPIPDEFQPYTDLRKLGEQFAEQNPGLFMGNCYVAYPKQEPAPVYDGQPSNFPQDQGWTLKLKLVSPAVPDGIWMKRMTSVDRVFFEERDLALDELQADDLEDCTLLDVQCALPGVGSLIEQYSSIGELLRDVYRLEQIMDKQREKIPDFDKNFAAALEYENCHNLHFAMDVAQNIHCYEFEPSSYRETLVRETFAAACAYSELMESSGFDVERYTDHLLERYGYKQTADGSYVTRNKQEFVYEHSRQARDDMIQNDFDDLAALPGSLQKQIWIKERLETLSVRETYILSAAIMRHPPENANEAVACLQSLDCYDVCFPAGSYEQLGRFYLKYQTELPDSALPYVDFEKLGQQYEDQYPGLFIGNCYVAYPEQPAKPYWQENRLPLLWDDGWSVKLKLASPAVPEGVWLRLPDVSGLGFEEAVEMALVRDALQVQRLDDCTLLETQCIFPELGNLMEQYDSIEELVADGNYLGCIMGEQGEPQWMERFTAALEYEGCRSLRFALDISQNLQCYEWVSFKKLADFAANHLRSESVPEEIIQSGCIDLKEYAEDLLETSGYMLSSGETGYTTRNNRKFQWQYSQDPDAVPTQTMGQ